MTKVKMPITIAALTLAVGIGTARGFDLKTTPCNAMTGSQTIDDLGLSYNSDCEQDGALVISQTGEAGGVVKTNGCGGGVLITDAHLRPLIKALTDIANQIDAQKAAVLDERERQLLKERHDQYLHNGFN